MRKLLLLSALLWSFIGSTLAASVEEKKIFLFFNPAVRLRLEMESKLPSLKAQRPDIADEIDQVPSRFDAEELADRTAAALSGKLTKKEMASLMMFIDSPAGHAMHEMLSEQNPKKRQTLENRVNPTHFQQIIVFTESALGKKVLALLNSPTTAKIQNDYGLEIMCTLIKESKPAAFEQLHTQGACAR